MTLVLRPLLNVTATLLNQLWHARMRKPVSVLLPDWMDPGLPDPVDEPASEEEAVLRARLLAIAAQLRAAGPAAAARDVLRRRELDAGRQAALLALAATAEWERSVPAPGRVSCTRMGADGLTYRVETEIAGGAEHAEHAALALRQALHLQDATQTHVLTHSAGTFCFSMLCALRDLVVLLVQAGESFLAAEVAEAAGLPAALLPAGLSAVAEARRLAG